MCEQITAIKPNSPDTSVLERTNPDNLKVLEQLLIALRNPITLILFVSCGWSLRVAHLHWQTRPLLSLLNEPDTHVLVG